MKIGVKIILVIAVLMVVSAATSGIIYYTASKQIVENEINAHLESVATLKENQLSTLLEGEKNQIEEITNDLEEFPGIKDSQGGVALTQNTEGVRLLLRTRLSSGVFEFFVLDLNGKILVSTDPRQEGKFRSDESYFINGRKETYVQNFYYDIALGQLASTISTPIKDTKGKLIGVFAGRLNLATVSKLMAERSGLGDTGETYLMDKFNTIISGTRSSDVGGFTRMIYTDGAKDCLVKHNGSHFVNYENIPVIGIHKWISSEGMCLIAEIKQQEAYGPIDYLRLVSLLVGFGSVIFTVIMGELIAHSLTKPILRLRENTRQIIGGNLDTKISITTKDEIGELAADFKKMTEQLRTYTMDLEEEKARLLASINSLSLGFIMMDTRGDIIVLNQMVKNLFRTDVITFEDVVSKFSATVDIADSYRHVLEIKANYEIRDVTFEDKFFRIMFTPIFLSENIREVIGLVILLEDISEVKRLEQSKDAFLSIAAHEMRTPLTIIRGNAELLLDEPATNANMELKTQIESVLQSAVRLLGIVNDFLDVQNLEGGRVAQNIESVDIVAVLKDSARDLSVLAVKKGLALSLDIPPDSSIPLLNLDKYRLQQIYINLISNAIHYTEHGNVTISIQKDGESIKILFKDTGIGISAEEQRRLFGKFETGRVFMQSKEYGSGLGLYISRFLARLMGGDVVLEKSEVGKGSVFALKLPLKGVPKNS